MSVQTNIAFILEDMKMKKIIALALALLMVLALCACGSEKAESSSDLEYVKSQGKLIVGITDFAPMDYKDANGEWIGFDADMAKAFAKSLGIEAEFIEIDWDNKILELNAKSIDAVWNGMTLTPEVTSSMECTNPYWINAQVIVVPADVADKYQTAESIADLAIAVEAGSAGEAAVKDLGYECTALSTQADALMNVAAGTADACVIDLSMANAMIGEGTSYADLTYTAKLNSEEYGVGFRKGSDLAAAFNEFYAKAYADGTVTDIANTYEVAEFIIAAE